jgi:hypothetical protein
LLGFIIAYPLIYNSLVTKDSLINHSYKDFLLRYTNSPRLIIDSGSNSVYGVNSGILEKELRILTINVADNAGYPLREKLYRLEKFTHKGDVIMLPLEWSHYFFKETPWFFLENLFAELNFYYHEMPILIKLNLIAKLPFSSTVRILFKKITQPTLIENQIQAEYKRFIDYEDRFRQKERGDSKEAIMASNNKDKGVSCNEYIFGKGLGYDVLKSGFIISEQFKQNIELIKKLQNKGVQVLFTWPTVVGDGCYQGKYADSFQAFVIKIKHYLNQNNILFVGEPDESRFEKNYLFNSYYHVIAVARDNRTKKLVELIQKSPAKTWFKQPTGQSPSLTLTTNLIESQLANLLAGSLAGISHHQLLTISRQNKLFLAKGWYPIEPWGVWSKENESVLYVKLKVDLLQQDLKLVIENNLYGTQDKTTVLINDKKLGDYLLADKNSLVIPKQFLNANDGLVKIQFNHHHVKSPLEYGENRDPRKLKFGLKSLQFSRI